MKMIGKLLGALAIFLIAAWPLQAQVYQWVDENGVKHYSNSLPPEHITDVREVEEMKSGPADERPSEGEQESSAEAEGGGSAEEAGEAEPVEERQEAPAAETEKALDIEEDRPESPTAGQAEEEELIEQ
jgi:hypothetical protein